MFKHRHYRVPKQRPAIYISGAMTGLEDHGLAAFARAAALLREQGWTVWSPGENDVDNAVHDDNIAPEVLRLLWRWDLCKLLEVSAVYMLDGWRNSDGATVEHSIAQKLGLHIIYETAPVEQLAAAA